MITISDVAARAGVSAATVSYVLNDRTTSVRISEDTRSRVMESAAELGYRRNEFARAMITGKTQLLGFWVMQSNREPVVRVLAGAMKEADNNGYFIKMLGFDNGSLDSRILERCVEWRLAGVIVIHAPSEAVSSLQPKLDNSGIPIVIVDGQQQPEGSISIRSRDEHGITSLVEHLVSLGHSNIAFIGGKPKDDVISLRREQAYLCGMKRFNLARFSRVEYGCWEADCTERVARQMLSHKLERPTAVLCAGDHTAMVVIRTAVEMGIAVPHDLSVVGFDDLAAAELYNPPLTTVAQPFEEMGRVAVQRLLRCISAKEQKNSGSDEILQELVTTRLIVRGSTASVPKAGVSVNKA
jgi:LacI family transcriptional regulator